MTDWPHHPKQRHISRSAGRDLDAPPVGKRASDRDPSPSVQEPKPVQPGNLVGTVISLHGNHFKCHTERGLFHVHLTGRHKRGPRRERAPLAVGDRVEVAPQQSTKPEGVLVQVMPRTTKLSRPSPDARRREHVLAANVDQVLIVIAIDAATRTVGALEQQSAAEQQSPDMEQSAAERQSATVEPSGGSRQPSAPADDSDDARGGTDISSVSAGASARASSHEEPHADDVDDDSSEDDEDDEDDDDDRDLEPVDVNEDDDDGDADDSDDDGDDDSDDDGDDDDDDIDWDDLDEDDPEGMFALVRTNLVDRVLIAAERGSMGAVIALNKVDLALPELMPTLDAVRDLYESLGHRCVYTSATTRQGLDELVPLLAGKTSVLAGPSGAGKSSLINAIDPTLHIRTAPVNRRSGRGRHTTTAVTLLPLNVDGGGFIVDTPGVREFAHLDLAPGDVYKYFPEIEASAIDCAFRNCAHTPGTPGCAVVPAVESGRIALRRYASFLALVTSIQADQPEV